MSTPTAFAPCCRRRPHTDPVAQPTSKTWSPAWLMTLSMKRNRFMPWNRAKNNNRYLRRGFLNCFRNCVNLDCVVLHQNYDRNIWKHEKDVQSFAGAVGSENIVFRGFQNQLADGQGLGRLLLCYQNGGTGHQNIGCIVDTDRGVSAASNSRKGTSS